MNELRQFKQGKRVVGELTIVFHEKDTIYLLDKHHQTIIQRWWKVRNSWPSWRLMVKALKTRKNLTYGQALGLAIQYGFGTSSARRVPNIEHYENIGRNNETDN